PLVGGSDWIALGAIIVSVVAVAVGFRANQHAGRSATASERSAVAAEASARAATEANKLQEDANKLAVEASRAAARRGMPTLIIRINGRRVEGKVATVELP